MFSTGWFQEWFQECFDMLTAFYIVKLKYIQYKLNIIICDKVNLNIVYLLLLQELSIDIADRDPTDHPGGISYKLLAEACIPSINVDDLGSIFEEHRVCKNLSVWQHTNSVSYHYWFGLN